MKSISVKLFCSAAIVCAIILSWQNTFAQVDYVQTTWLGNAQDSRTRVLQIDDEGNAYVVMSSRYNINFFGQVYDRHGAGYYSVIGKVSASGKLLWSRTISLINGTDQIDDLQVDNNKNIYISGAGSTIELDNGTVLESGTFLIKFDKAGKTLWGLISENTFNMTSMTGGPIALATDGVYWSSIFYSKLNLQGRVLNTNNPNGGSPDAFIAKVSAEGKVTDIYHDPSRSSICQILVPSDNGQATAVMMGGSATKHKVVLDEKCNVISDNPFLIYGDFVRRIAPVSKGYQMLTYVYSITPSGWVVKGFYDIRFDSYLNVTDSVKLFSNPGDWRVYDIISNSSDNYFFVSPTSSGSTNFDWFLTDGKSNNVILPEENTSFFGTDVFTRSFLKVAGDTLNMLVRHLNYSTTKFTFDNKDYETSSNLLQSFFWVKYVYKDPDSCKKVKVEVVNNGREGDKDVHLKLKLPSSCPALEDISIELSLEHEELNKNDFVIPNNVILKKGDIEVDLWIRVTDDNVVENTESFTLNLSTGTGSGYAMSSATVVYSIVDDDNKPENRQYSILYTPAVKEGNSGMISVSLPEGMVFSDRLDFTFNQSPHMFKATPSLDYSTIEISIAAGEGKAEIKTDVFNDQTLEGEEFISGELSLDTNIFGEFTCTNKVVLVSIEDADDIPENRVLIITPEQRILSEGNSNTYTIRMEQPVKLQDKIDLLVFPFQWLPFLNQHAGDLFLDSITSSAGFTLTYPEDMIIRENKHVKLVLSGKGVRSGSFRFKYADQIIDTLIVQSIDNDHNSYTAISIPNTFTPNGDGINDTWAIKDLSSDKECKITIFNRYGDVIYFSKGYSDTWNGTSKGNIIPDGTYHYIITSNKQVLSGSVTIIR